MTTVGIVGAGQLARMTAEAASALGLSVAVLAERPDDPATAVVRSVVAGRPDDPQALNQLVALCDVVTFDHEQVDLEAIAALEGQGATIRPGVDALRFGVDKGHMRTVFDAAGLPLPAHAVLEVHDVPTAMHRLSDFAAEHGWPLVLKPSHGGYDGKGVWMVDELGQAVSLVELCAQSGTRLVVEERVVMEAELSVMVARRPGGEIVSWPVVETAQVDGMCREVLVPGAIAPEVRAAAGDLARKVAAVTRVVGVMAVEMFWSGGALLVNEVAPRPHNSGHWTIEGSITSQFENHLRAILDLPLGSTDLTAPAVASVNVLGDGDGSDPGDRLAKALGVAGAHVHLYGKAPRPGRKLGHVTVCGNDSTGVRAGAWAAARALGTPEPAAAVAAGPVAR